MHEANLVRQLVRKIDSVARENSVQHVDLVRIEIGSQSHLTSETLRAQFEVLSHDSLAQGAQLDVREVPETDDIRIVSIVAGDE
jgi:hydrogenase nickel incorporation protein HypA/HybF